MPLKAQRPRPDYVVWVGGDFLVLGPERPGSERLEQHRWKRLDHTFSCQIPKPGHCAVSPGRSVPGHQGPAGGPMAGRPSRCGHTASGDAAPGHWCRGCTLASHGIRVRLEGRLPAKAPIANPSSGTTTRGVI